MTKQERKYLRSAYYHYLDKIQKSSALLTDSNKLIEFVDSSIMLREIVYQVLCLESDEDEVAIDKLSEIFEDENIEIL